MGNSDVLPMMGLPQGMLALLKPARQRGSAPTITINGRKVEVKEVLTDSMLMGVSGCPTARLPGCDCACLKAPGCACGFVSRAARRRLSVNAAAVNLTCCWSVESSRWPASLLLVQRLILECCLARAAAKGEPLLNLGLQLAVADEQEPADGLLLTWSLGSGHLHVDSDDRAQHSWLAQHAAQHYSTAVTQLGAGMPAGALPCLAHLAHTLERQSQLQGWVQDQMQQAAVSGKASYGSVTAAMRGPLTTAAAYEKNRGSPLPNAQWEGMVQQVQQQHGLDIGQLAQAVVGHAEQGGYARVVRTGPAGESQGNAGAEGEMEA